jgi:uncharacterized membrane protein
LRLAAAFQMLQGHTLAALMAPELRHGALFTAWSSARGLTAVAFLFTAGMSVYLAAVTARSPLRALRPSGRRVRRALGLIALGYLLHMPLPVPGGADGGVRDLLAVDVLQCTGVSLLLAELLLACARRRGWLVGCGVCASLSFAGVPFAQELSVRAPLLVAGYLGTASGALFPLFPWSGHLFAGVVCAGLVAERRSSATGLLLLLGGTLLAFGRLLLAASPRWLTVADHLARLGAVVCVAALLARALRSVQRPPRWLATLATESLVLYVFHIALVYGRPWGLVVTIGPTLALGPALGVTALVIGGSCGAALLYRRARARIR